MKFRSWLDFEYFFSHIDIKGEENEPKTAIVGKTVSDTLRAFSMWSFVNFSCLNFAISKVAKRRSKFLHVEDAALKRVFRFAIGGGVFPTLLDMIAKRILTAVQMAHIYAAEQPQ